MENINEQDPMVMSVNPETEPRIIIDGDLRSITIPDELINIGVAGDHYAETVYFTCPRYFDGIDLSSKNCEIHFVNAAGYTGISKALDLALDGESSITFGWEIDRRVTVKSGKVVFAVYFLSTEDRGYQYGTTTASLNILNGLDDGQIMTDQDNTLLHQVLNQLSEIQTSLDVVKNDISELRFADINMSNQNNLLSGELTSLKEKVAFLTDNVIYTSNLNT